jgi:hypothetical protein
MPHIEPTPRPATEPRSADEPPHAAQRETSPGEARGRSAIARADRFVTAVLQVLNRGADGPGRRGTIATVVLAVVVGLLTAGGTLATSVRDRDDNAYLDHVRADLVVSGNAAPIDPATADRIRAIRNVDLAVSHTEDTARVNGAEVTVHAWDDPGGATLMMSRSASSGSIEPPAPDEIVMNQSTAQALAVRVGDRVIVGLTRTAPRDYRLAGVYADTHVEDGIYVPWADAQAGFRDPRPDSMYLELAPGYSAQDVQRAATGLLDGTGATVLPPDEAVDEVGHPFDVALFPLRLLAAAALILSVLLAALSALPRHATPVPAFKRRANLALSVTLTGLAIANLAALALNTPPALPWP